MSANRDETSETTTHMFAQCLLKLRTTENQRRNPVEYWKHTVPENTMNNCPNVFSSHLDTILCDPAACRKNTQTSIHCRLPAASI